MSVLSRSTVLGIGFVCILRLIKFPISDENYKYA